MELKDTINLMNSEDYKERFKAEYYQTKIRYEKLNNMIIKYKSGTLDFIPVVPVEELTTQSFHMGNYLIALEKRAKMEKIEL